MSYVQPSQDEFRTILEKSNTVAVVGLSDDPTRTSHLVAAAMQQRGYKIIPVNPKASTILGETCYAKLQDVPVHIDIVNVFRRSEYCLEVAKDAVEVGADTLWLQQGITNEEAHAYAKEHGLNVVMDACIKVIDAVVQPKRS
ncbi:CoA-binding protein [Paenibacillus sp. 1001270B_150601_E10]|uniref:CoA-binding protein n=1 Tax=Paenibacillus sp. 1001270B_150601_E10 TaxID=2787079 RepID=UPI00189D7C64|nr:CoA-binding protein [Paenibacillus sp. 1001270B_150601_E10]